MLLTPNTKHYPLRRFTIAAYGMQSYSLNCTHPVADLKWKSMSYLRVSWQEEQPTSKPVKPLQEVTLASILIPSALSARGLH